jgi:uncharacterized protein (TIGR04255 family)
VVYNKNYLVRVIWQFKFDAILELEDANPAEFQKLVKDRFPSVKEAQLVQLAVSSGKSFSAELSNLRKQWTFSNGVGAALTLSADQFTLEYSKFESIEAMHADFAFLWEPFQRIYGPSTLTRTGLRYINNVVLPSGNPLD